MRINPEKTKARQQDVPERDRVYIYDAGLPLKFIRDTFVPTEAYLPPGYRPEPSMQIYTEEFRDAALKHGMAIAKLYDLYIDWRTKQPFTRPLETRYVFSLIVKRARFYRNGVEFSIYRRGAAQTWTAGPIQYRGKEPEYMPGTMHRVEDVPRFVTDDLDRFKEARAWEEAKGPA
jgi:hypothetical protein